MADFNSWDQKNLASFAYECQDEIKRLQEERNRLHQELIKEHNKYGKLLTIVKNLLTEYEYILKLYNRTPEKQKAYMEGMEVFK